MNANVISLWINRRAGRDRRNDCARVNETVAQQILRGMSDAELKEHIAELDVTLQAKQAGVQSTMQALARALSEKSVRCG